MATTTLSAPGANTMERLNNSIAKIQFIAQPGLRPATDQLQAHWQRYWDSAEGRYSPSPAKMRRYGEWYARAWALLTPELRARAYDPRTLDTTWLAAIDDNIRGIVEGAAVAGAAGQSAEQYVQAQASALGRAMTSRVLPVLALAVLGLAIWKSK